LHKLRSLKEFQLKPRAPLKNASGYRPKIFSIRGKRVKESEQDASLPWQQQILRADRPASKIAFIDWVLHQDVKRGRKSDRQIY
jgi:hypothetical protein